jgi:hypothetical protein
VRGDGESEPFLQTRQLVLELGDIVPVAAHLQQQGEIAAQNGHAAVADGAAALQDTSGKLVDQAGVILAERGEDQVMVLVGRFFAHSWASRKRYRSCV